MAQSKITEVVHMNCRARHPITGDTSCDGTTARVNFVREVPADAGTMMRMASYTCEKCGQTWTISF